MTLKDTTLKLTPQIQKQQRDKHLKRLRIEKVKAL
jgi:hypothetical protein